LSTLAYFCIFDTLTLCVTIPHVLIRPRRGRFAYLGGGRSTESVQRQTVVFCITNIIYY